MFSYKVWAPQSKPNQHSDHTFSALKIRQFNTKNPSGFWCWHERCFELKGFWCWTDGFLMLNSGVLNWRVCWTEGCVELKIFGVELTAFWCWTDGRVELRLFFVLNWRILGLKKSDHFVLNWCVELRGSRIWKDGFVLIIRIRFYDLFILFETLWFN